MYGANIRQLRKAKKITQQDFAKLFGVDNTTISVWELEKAEPSIKHLITMAKFFGVTIDEIIGYDKDAGAKKE